MSACSSCDTRGIARAFFIPLVPGFLFDEQAGLWLAQRAVYEPVALIDASLRMSDQGQTGQRRKGENIIEYHGNSS